jgi:hypothetical protein
VRNHGQNLAAVSITPSKLAARLVPFEPCPCEGCRLALRCDAERLACVAFSLFMAGNPQLQRGLVVI